MIYIFDVIAPTVFEDGYFALIADIFALIIQI